MKFREQTVQYDIDKHGSAYVDYSTPVYICPECSSAETSLKKGCTLTYVCPDCGCEFRPHKVYVITKAGKTMRIILSVLIVLCVIGVIVGLIAPVAFYQHQEKILGEEVAKELYLIKCAVTAVVTVTASFLLGCFCSIKYENI